jgi:acyl-[acyl-carrier-protein]-phospholipid O-acyltransferase/long-chain-fatty-acid--[acyl-carrier-protein] ligase
LLRPGLDPSAGEESLFDALVAARAKFGDKEIIEDQDRKPLTYTGLIRAAFVLGRKIAALTAPAERVGILLPSSMGVVVTFFGLHAFGRVPVMLNFTSGAAPPAGPAVSRSGSFSSTLLRRIWPESSMRPR